jgi:hypothetical protein
MHRQEWLCQTISARLASCRQPLDIARDKSAREEQHAIKIRTEKQQSFTFSQREVEVSFKFAGKERKRIEQGVRRQISINSVEICFHQIHIQPFTFAEHAFGAQQRFIAQVDCGQQPSVN